VRLTDAGETLLPRIRRALSEIDAGREQITALTGLQTGRVRLEAMQALGRLLAGARQASRPRRGR
jgi:DNA-binding transcriptional LysR family regulator